MTKTITITGNSIPLAKTLAKKWRGRQVQFTATDTMMVIQSQVAAEAWKRIQAAPKKLIPLAEIDREIAKTRSIKPMSEWRKLKGAGRGITKRDIDDAIRAVRSES